MIKIRANTSTTTEYGTTVSNMSRATVQADLTPGTYWIGVIADDANTVDEEDETNNIEIIQIGYSGAYDSQSWALINLRAYGRHTQQAELVALMWLGRGDEEPEEWVELLKLAEERRCKLVKTDSGRANQQGFSLLPLLDADFNRRTAIIDFNA